MDEINRKRLEWMAQAKAGDIPPDEIGFPVGAWAAPAAEAAKAALDEIERLRTGTIYHQWQPIDSAPIEPWNKVVSYYSFRCMLQDADGFVREGEGYYVCPPRSKEQRILRWRNNLGQCFPKYWMPLPAAKQE
jgi:hypothetical protein